MDWIGVAIFLAGFSCECIADEQKSAWNRRNRFGQAHLFISFIILPPFGVVSLINAAFFHHCRAQHANDLDSGRTLEILAAP